MTLIPRLLMGVGRGSNRLFNPAGVGVGGGGTVAVGRVIPHREATDGFGSSSGPRGVGAGAIHIMPIDMDNSQFVGASKPAAS
jgi:hypothetical protein